jgi:valyl-tRNA synthetase
MGAVVEVVKGIRNARAEYQVDAGRWVEALIFAGELESAIRPHLGVIETLARARPVTFLKKRPEKLDASQNIVMVLGETEVVLPMASLVDVAAEKKRLEQEIAQCQGEVARLEKLLGDGAFCSKAPEAVVLKQQQALDASRSRLERLKQQLGRFDIG